MRVKYLVVGLITVYQRLFSPASGALKLLWQSPLLNLGIGPAGCRHYPSCSELAKKLILTKGLLKGTRAALAQIANCHNFK